MKAWNSDYLVVQLLLWLTFLHDHVMYSRFAE